MREETNTIYTYFPVYCELFFPVFVTEVFVHIDYNYQIEDKVIP